MSTLSRVRRAASPNASATEPSPARPLTRAPRSTTPRAARLIARGYTWFIRRTIAIVSPLRRATEAWNLIASSPGMPASTTRPPGRTDSTATRTALSLPAASNATSTPAPVSSRRSITPGSATRSAPYRAARARRLEHADQQQPDRSAADHRRGAGERQVPEVHAVNGHPERLEQRAVRVGHRVRQRVQQVRGPGHELAHHAVGLAVPGEPDPVAQVRVAVPAGSAGPAGARRVDGAPLTAPRSPR